MTKALTWTMVIFLGSCTIPEEAPAREAPAPETSTRLKRIDDPSSLCMAADRALDRPMVPASVEDRTYYGCCAGCAARLREHGALRTATDPSTGREVDKADAILGRTEEGTVLYFESEASFARYAAAQD